MNGMDLSIPINEIFAHYNSINKLISMIVIDLDLGLLACIPPGVNVTKTAKNTNNNVIAHQ